MTLTPSLTALLAAAACCAFSSTTHAANVLTIDISNPAAVTFTSTPALSETNSSLNIGTDGFTIQNFFALTVLVPDSTLATGDLMPTGSTFVYAGMGTFSFEANNGTFAAGNDLSVFANGAPMAGSQVFSTVTRAFNGTMVVDMSPYIAALPAAGTTGTVYSGFRSSGITGHGLVVGQYSVVPEPNSIALALLGMTALARRKRSLGN